MKMIKSLAIVACLAAPVSAQTPSTAAPAATASAADVAGTWDVTFNAAQGPIPAQIKLTKGADNKLTGTVSSDLGSSTLEAEVKAKAVSIWFNFASQNGPMVVEMTGTADGNSMKGTMTAGGQPAGDWLATRAKETPTAATTTAAPPTTSTAAPASANSLTGTWNVSVELPSMTANPTIVLKQDGEKLTGDYVSAQYGKFAVTGTAKGTDVIFWFAMSVEGSALNVTYTGALDKDGSLKGTVNYGDMMNGTFIATKKK